MSSAYYAMLYGARADYDAWAAPAEEARRVIELALAFLGSIKGVVE